MERDESTEETLVVEDATTKIMKDNLIVARLLDFLIPKEDVIPIEQFISFFPEDQRNMEFIKLLYDDIQSQHKENIVMMQNNIISSFSAFWKKSLNEDEKTLEELKEETKQLQNECKEQEESLTKLGKKIEFLPDQSRWIEEDKLESIKKLHDLLQS